ncbi:hypothetical protein GCM10023188_43100 [Pontibacter saemangeumensis]|uniref:Uncharacterized protein n=1 Tax=Pontibacter saemangeumensis TaxID=1084525 RepID=A0ABP8M2J5_9BACT
MAPAMGFQVYGIYGVLYSTYERQLSTGSDARYDLLFLAAQHWDRDELLVMLHRGLLLYNLYMFQAAKGINASKKPKAGKNKKIFKIDRKSPPFLMNGWGDGCFPKE